MAISELLPDARALLSWSHPVRIEDVPYCTTAAESPKATVDKRY